MVCDILFRFVTLDDFWFAMQTLGIQCNPSAREEEQMQSCATPTQVTHQGYVRTVRFTDAEQLAKVPDVLTPTFVIDMRSDEDNTDYEPSYTADLTDADGNLYVGAVMPGVIAS